MLDVHPKTYFSSFWDKSRCKSSLRKEIIARICSLVRADGSNIKCPSSNIFHENLSNWIFVRQVWIKFIDLFYLYALSRLRWFRLSPDRKVVMRVIKYRFCLGFIGKVGRF